MIHATDVAARWGAAFLPGRALGDRHRAFVDEMTALNLRRVGYLSPFLAVLFTGLLVIDLRRLGEATESAERLGARLILLSHIGIVVLTALAAVLCLLRRRAGKGPLSTGERLLLDGFVTLLMLGVTTTTIGDLLISANVLAFVGSLFAFSVFIVMQPGFAALFYGSNTALILIGVVAVDLPPASTLNLLVNLSSFSLVALLVSRYMLGVQISEFVHAHEQEALISSLETALREVKQLSGLLPICAHCKKIRDDSGYWNQIEAYLDSHTEATFSHSICPDCLAEHYHEDLHEP